MSDFVEELLRTVASKVDDMQREVSDIRVAMARMEARIHTTPCNTSSEMAKRTEEMVATLHQLTDRLKKIEMTVVLKDDFAEHLNVATQQNLGAKVAAILWSVVTSLVCGAAGAALAIEIGK